MKHTIKHDLDVATARKVARKACETYAQRFTDYNPQATWVNDDKAKISFKAKGMSLDGVIELRPGAIDLDLDVPFLLKPFQGKAVGIIEQEMQKWISKAKAGEV